MPQRTETGTMNTEGERERIRGVLEGQRAFFRSGQTLPYEWRMARLTTLAGTIRRHEEDIARALQQDLGKSPFESYATETGLVLAEITAFRRHLKKWMRARRTRGELRTFPARYRTYPQPFGTALVISPWNYPFLLSMEPLIAAVAAGNTVILKPSEHSPETSALLAQVVAEAFAPEEAAVVEGGYVQNQLLLHERFDFIFFTGSPAVGKAVMEGAARNLTPVCLELGGKSPCIVDETANVRVAARRVAWAKLLNAGQTCVAPDYVLVHESVKEAFLAALAGEITRQYGTEPLLNAEYPRIVNKKHFNRLLSLSPESEADSETNRIAPTVMDLGALSSADASHHPVMHEEIFGPLLPVISYTGLDEAMAFINDGPSPLSLSLFSRNKAAQKAVIQGVRFGGGCINDVALHVASGRLPFGGIGQSGMGSYHGKHGFDTFTHQKGMLIQSPALDVPLRYAPHGKKLSLLRLFLR